MGLTSVRLGSLRITDINLRLLYKAYSHRVVLTKCDCLISVARHRGFPLYRIHEGEWHHKIKTSCYCWGAVKSGVSQVRSVRQTWVANISSISPPIREKEVVVKRLYGAPWPLMNSRRSSVQKRARVQAHREGHVPSCILQGKPQNYFRSRSVVNARRWGFKYSNWRSSPRRRSVVRHATVRRATIAALTMRKLNEPRRNSSLPSFTRPNRGVTSRRRLRG